MPEPSTASDPWLRRVQALLAKAESTEYPEEAEALGQPGLAGSGRGLPSARGSRP